VAPERAPVWCTSGGTEICFVASKSTISRFGERFCDGQYSFGSFVFAVLKLMVPPMPRHL